MSQRTGVIGESIDRVQNAYSNIENEVQKFQKDLDKRRKNFEKRAEKEFKRFRKELRKNDFVKRAESIQQDVNGQIEAGLDNFLGSLKIASRSEIEKIDKKLNRINKKLNQIDKAMSSKSASQPAAAAVK